MKLLTKIIFSFIILQIVTCRYYHYSNEVEGVSLYFFEDFVLIRHPLLNCGEIYYTINQAIDLNREERKNFCYLYYSKEKVVNHVYYIEITSKDTMTEFDIVIHFEDGKDATYFSFLFSLTETQEIEILSLMQMIYDKVSAFHYELTFEKTFDNGKFAIGLSPNVISYMKKGDLPIPKEIRKKFKPDLDKRKLLIKAHTKSTFFDTKKNTNTNDNINNLIQTVDNSPNINRYILSISKLKFLIIEKLHNEKYLVSLYVKNTEPIIQYRANDFGENMKLFLIYFCGLLPKKSCGAYCDLPWIIKPEEQPMIKIIGYKNGDVIDGPIRIS
jgi:hypothetical protein